MINIYQFHHCPSLLATPGFELTTSRSQSGDVTKGATTVLKLGAWGGGVPSPLGEGSGEGAVPLPQKFFRFFI